MSIEIIPYQPLPFNLEENCTLPCSNWIQKIQKSDATSIQFINTPCVTADTILSNGNFASGGTDWTQNGTWVFSSFTATSPIATSGFIEQTVDIGEDGYYEISFNATVNNGTLVLSSTSATLIDYVTSSGNYSFTTFLEVGDTINFFFNTALGGNISNILCKPINARVRLDVLDLDGNVEATIPDSFYTFNQGFLTANFNWSTLALADGCYKLAIYDPCQCAQFGFMGDNFDTPNQFVVVDGTATITGGIMTFTSTGVVQVRSRALLCNSTDYTVTYRLAGMNPSDDFRINLGGSVGTLRTADGNYTETITTPASGTVPVRFLVNNAVALSSFNVSNFSIEAVTPVITYESVPFQLKETHDCSVLVEACGVGEEFNFGFNYTGFKPIIRLESTYRTANYPTTKTEYEYSTGRKETPYMRTRRAKTLLFGAPEYVHDFARLWLGISNLYINGELSASEDSEPPTISWEEDVDLGLATFTFSKKTELTEKRSCTTLPNIGCDVNGFELQIERTGGYNITPSILATAQGVEIQFGN
jgi:hypothetical protein